MQAEIKEKSIQAELESLLSLVTEISLTLKEHRYIFGQDIFLFWPFVMRSFSLWIHRFLFNSVFSICSRSRDGSFS